MSLKHKGGAAMTEQELKQMASYITYQLYKDFGSEKGYLFGLKPDDRSAVEVIIYLALKYLQESKTQT